MAIKKGRLGAIYAPTVAASSLGDINVSEIGSTGVYFLSTNSIQRETSFTQDAVIGDFTVNDDSGTVAPTAINIPLGRVSLAATWSTASGQIGITCTSKALVLSQIAGFSDWSINGGPQSADVTEMGDTWTEQCITLKDWSGTATSFWQDNDFTVDAAANHIDITDAPFTAKFFVDDTSGTYNAFVGNVVITGFDITTPVAGVVTKTINFAGIGELYFDTQDPTV